VKQATPSACGSGATIASILAIASAMVETGGTRSRYVLAPLGTTS
jgi:hypothetical protein